MNFNTYYNIIFFHLFLLCLFFSQIYVSKAAVVMMVSVLTGRVFVLLTSRVSHAKKVFRRYLLYKIGK